MASGYTQKPAYYGRKPKNRRTIREIYFPCKILVKDGKTLDTPEIQPTSEADSLAWRLRQSAPGSERMLVDAMLEFGFKHSYPLHGYVADFYHPEACVCVEIDGSVHRNRKAKDRLRDRILFKHGVETYRFWASSCYQERERIITHVKHILQLKGVL
jgi:very-short-patch-repair endonuclease